MLVASYVLTSSKLLALFIRPGRIQRENDNVKKKNKCDGRIKEERGKAEKAGEKR